MNKKSINTLLRELRKAFNESDSSKEYESKCKDIYFSSNVTYDVFQKIKNMVC